MRRGDPGLQAGEETPLPPFGVSRGIPTQETANIFDMTKMVKRAYKYRFYPTPEQAAELSRTFGCVRKVWNLALEARTTAWHQRHEHVSYLQSSAMLTQWKHSDDLAGGRPAVKQEPRRVTAGIPVLHAGEKSTRGSWTLTGPARRSWPSPPT